MRYARTAAHCIALLLALTVHVEALAQTDGLQKVQQLVQRGELAPALSQVDAYLKLHPTDARWRFMLGVILGDQNKINEAMTVYQRLIGDYPELPEPYNNLAALYARKGEYEQARRVLKMAIAARPGYVTAHENLGDIYLKLAALSYAKVVELDPEDRSAQKKLKIIDELIPKTAASANDLKPAR